MLNLQMLNMPKGVKKPRRFNKGRYGCMDIEFADNAYYWNSGDSLVGVLSINIEK
jgi:hypothetical protein